MTTPVTSPFHKSGLPPGSLIHIGELHHGETLISAIQYDKDTHSESTLASLDELAALRKMGGITWVNIEGLNSVQVVEQLGTLFDVHPLVLEDILNTNQRAKYEIHDDYLYFVLKGIYRDEQDDSDSVFSYEQFSILLFENMVITICERRSNLFHPIIRRIKREKSQIRKLAGDYLVYVILDAIVDQYFCIQDVFDDAIDSVESRLLTDPDKDTLAQIQDIKRELIQLRRTLTPIRDMLATILNIDTHLIDIKTRIYFRDVYDHILRVSESTESFRDMVTGLLDIYVSSISNKMNEVMKVLTVFASIFIPLTFLTGIYGMNFEYMPELKLHWAYPVLWGVFIALPISLLLFFKKKKWL